MTLIRLACCFAVACSLCGCSARDEKPNIVYAGEDAIVLRTGQSEDQSKGVFSVSRQLDIVEVDESGYLGIPFEVHLAPGKHVVKLHYRTGNANAIFKLWFIGEPGHNYHAKYVPSRFGTSYRAWIEDEATGLPVGGLAE